MMSIYDEIKYIVLDVDGVMTDAGIYYDDNGNELKKFTTRDAAGFFAFDHCGIRIIVITGRECGATKRRLTELGVKEIYQHINNKRDFLNEYIKRNKIKKEEIAYVGDDLNDLPSMALCGFVACPLDACSEVQEISDYISKKNGGYGVVRDVAEHILKKKEMWVQAVSKEYGVGV